VRSISYEKCILIKVDHFLIDQSKVGSRKSEDRSRKTADRNLNCSMVRRFDGVKVWWWTLD